MGQLVAIPDTTAALAKVVQGVHDAEHLAATFAPHFADFRQAAQVAITVQPDEPAKARQCRLSLRAIRVAAEKDRKALKEESVRTGRAIDGYHAVLEHALVPVEEAMREIEEAEQRREAARKAALDAERRAELSAYCDPAHYQLGEMDADAYASLLAMEKAAKAAAEEAARKAAEEAAAESERLRLAHEAKVAAEAEERRRLQAEAAAAREAQAAAEAAAAAERKAAAEALAKIQESAERERQARQAEEARLRAEADAREAAAREVARKAQAEVDRLAQIESDRQAAEAAAVQARLDAERKAAAAPDAAKLRSLAGTIADLSMPDCTTARGQEIRAKVRAELDSIGRRILAAVETL